MRTALCLLALACAGLAEKGTIVNPSVVPTTNTMALPTKGPSQPASSTATAAMPSLAPKASAATEAMATDMSTTAPTARCQRTPDADGNVIVDGEITTGFQGCLALKSITLKTSHDVPANAFAGCTQLHTAHITFLVPNASNSLAIVSKGAFEGCTALATVTIGTNSHTMLLGQGAFKNCVRLVDVTIGGHEYAFFLSEVFSGCTSLVTIALPATFNGFLYSGGKGAFYKCTSLETIVVESVFVAARVNPFPSCIGHGLEATRITYSSVVNLTEAPSKFFDEWGKVSRDEHNLIEGFTHNGNVTCQPCNGPELKIDGTVTVIHADSFYGCTAVESITLSLTTETIHPNAFRGFPRLRSVTAPAVTWERLHASFYGLPIDSAVFPSCFGASYLFGLETDANQTDTVSCLPCWGLSELTIPAAVTSVRAPAFDGCANLSRVDILDTVDMVAVNAFAGAPNIRHARIGDVFLEEGAFNGTQCPNAFAPNTTVCDCVAVEGGECYVTAAGEDTDDTNMIIGIAAIATVGVAGVGGAVYYRQRVMAKGSDEAQALL